MICAPQLERETVEYSSAQGNPILRILFGFIAVVVVVVVVVLLTVFVPRWNSTSGEKVIMHDRGATAETVILISTPDSDMNTSLTITTRAILPRVTSTVPRASSASDMSLEFTVAKGPDRSTTSRKASSASSSPRRSFAHTSVSALATAPPLPTTRTTRASHSPAKPTEHTTTLGRGRTVESENRTDKSEHATVSPKQVNRGLGDPEGPLTTRAHEDLSSAGYYITNSTDVMPGLKTTETVHGASSVNLTATFNGSGDPLAITTPPAAPLDMGGKENKSQATVTTSAVNITEPVHKSTSVNTTEDRLVTTASVAMTDIGTGINDEEKIISATTIAGQNKGTNPGEGPNVVTNTSRPEMDYQRAPYSTQMAAQSLRNLA
ncbi:uncharacterized protein LOC135400292 isoform X2 [Ornithodoros turicata]|uniref:uncharacterized protein LOC135400292 isoform X2 n=1 Tax=Ornithodoros turicata TaxID=34597 RepID=UPI003138B6AD